MFTRISRIPALAVLAGLSILPLAALADKEGDSCKSLSACEWDQCVTKEEITRAETENPKSVDGLRKHLANLENYCDPAKERANILDEIDKVRDEVRKLQDKRASESDKNASDKVAKLEKEIAEKRQTIGDLEKRLAKYD